MLGFAALQAVVHLRFAVRKQADNDRLLRALADVPAGEPGKGADA
jgi:histidinol-phosphate/aromatic aminotransferase/cobyric acid decarboxylase-like protein